MCWFWLLELCDRDAAVHDNVSVKSLLALVLIVMLNVMNCGLSI